MRPRSLRGDYVGIPTAPKFHVVVALCMINHSKSASAADQVKVRMMHAIIRTWCIMAICHAIDLVRPQAAASIVGSHIS